MKEKLCDQVAAKIAADEKLSAEEKLHADECVDCRNFLQFRQKLGKLSLEGDFEVPSALDLAVKQASFRHLAHRRRIRLFRTILIPAAAVLVLSGALLFHNRTMPEAETLKPVQTSSVHSMKAWSGDYDEKLFTMTCDMDDAMSNMAETIVMI